MTLVKTSVFNGFAVLVKTGCALILNKMLALYVGPGGYATIGQFQNFLSIIVSFTGGILIQGVTKITAQNYDNKLTQYAVWRTAIRVSLAASLASGAMLLMFREFLSESLLLRNDMSTIFVILALTLPATAANNLLLAITNGKKEVGVYVKANILGSIISLVLIGFLAYTFGLYGALIAMTINPAVVLLGTGFMVSRRDWFSFKYLWGKIDNNAIRGLSGFGLMGVTSALVGNLSYMLIREHITNTLGISAAGYWQAAYKISEMFSLLLTSTLAVYYLPRLAEIRTSSDLNVEIIHVYKIVLPVAILGSLMSFFLRDVVINLLFTPDFLPMRQLMGWQFAGEVVKIGSWILAYVMIGRALTRIFIVTEVLFSASFYVLSIFFVSNLGLDGVSVAYFVNGCLGWVCMIFIIRYEMRKMPN